MSLKGMPDWSHPLEGAGADLYFAHEDPLRLFAAPLDLSVVDEGPLGPAFALELVRVRNGSGPTVTGLLTIRFAGRYALPERQAAVFALHPGARLEPLPPRGGFLRFQSAEAVSLPPDILRPQPLVWSGPGSLTFAARLDSTSAALIDEALVRGLSLVTATAEVEAWGVASRCDGVVEFDPSVLRALIRASGSNRPTTAAALEATLAEAASEGGFHLEGVTTDAARIAAAAALSERLIGRFGRLEPTDDPGSGPTFAFDFDRMGSGRVRWDLAEPVLTPRTWVLQSNPLETARRAMASGFSVKREAPVIEFATGLHMLSLHPNIPARRVGVLMLGMEIVVPPHLPDRPQTVTGSATFRDGESSKTVRIRLAPDEPVAFDYQTVAFVRGEGGARRLTGPWRRHEGVHLTVPPDSFPVQFFRVEASQGLLATGVVHLHATGQTAHGPWSVEADLDASTPSLGIAAPLGLVDGTLGATVRALDGGEEIALAPWPIADCWLDVSSLPTFGPQRIEVACTFDDAAVFAAVECAPEDRVDEPGAVGLVRLTPEASVREWRWLSVDPFKNGFRWRWFASPGQPPSSWSEIRRPIDGPLVVRSGARAGASVDAPRGDP